MYYGPIVSKYMKIKCSSILHYNSAMPSYVPIYLIFFMYFLGYGVAPDDSQCISLFLNNITEEMQSSIVATLLNNAKNLLEEAEKYASKKTSMRYSIAGILCDKPMDCADVMERNPFAKSGVYKIWPRNRVTNGSIEVYCDMEDDGGAWTVIQRRGDFDSGEDYFYKDWQSYKNGFGSRTKDFWLGNDNIFALTNQRSNVVKFTLNDWENIAAYAIYDEFWIDDELHKYTMHVSGYSGTAGDSFSDTNGLPFSTKDQDNDSYDLNCAVLFKGAWWYSACHNSNLNGMYMKGFNEFHGAEWRSFKDWKYSLKDTVIKIRPKEFQKNPDDVAPL